MAHAEVLALALDAVGRRVCVYDLRRSTPSAVILGWRLPPEVFEVALFELELLGGNARLGGERSLEPLLLCGLCHGLYSHLPQSHGVAAVTRDASRCGVALVLILFGIVFGCLFCFYADVCSDLCSDVCSEICSERCSDVCYDYCPDVPRSAIHMILWKPLAESA